MRVRQVKPQDVPALEALLQELDSTQRDWEVFTPPGPGFYDEVGHKYREAMRMHDAVVLVDQHEDGVIVGMAYGVVNVPSRFFDGRALEISGVVVRAGHRAAGWAEPWSAGPPGSPPPTPVHGVTSRRSLRNEGSMAFWEGAGLHPPVVQLTSSTSALEGRMDDE